MFLSVGGEEPRRVQVNDNDVKMKTLTIYRFFITACASASRRSALR